MDFQWVLLMVRVYHGIGVGRKMARGQEVQRNGVEPTNDAWYTCTMTPYASEQQLQYVGQAISEMSMATLCRVALAHAKAGDLDGVFALLHEGKKRGMDHAMQDELLANDFVVSVIQCTGSNASTIVADWCERNADMMVACCPNILAQWNHPTKITMHALGRFFTDGSVAPTKYEILQGKDGSSQGQKLLHFLQKEPSYWSVLSPDWIGKPKSGQRQVAIALGWSPTFLPEMLNTFSWPMKDWVTAMAYPYSASIGAWMSSGQRWHRLDMIGLGATAECHPDSSTIVAVQGSNPLDMKLATILLARSTMDLTFAPYQNTLSVSGKDEAHLCQMVDTHLALNCIESLVHELCHDRIPGLSAQEQIDLELPNLDGFG